MNKLTFGLALGGLWALSACAKEEAAAPVAEAPVAMAAQPAAAKPEVVEIVQAATLFTQSAVPVDANNPTTREQFGVIPGAKLLSSSSNYDCTKELPADKNTPLVFYCGNEHCSASDAAAERAMANGYLQVKVLRAGIMGWKESGQATVPPAS